MWFDPTISRLFTLIFWLGATFAVCLVVAVLAGTGYGLAVMLHAALALHGVAP